MIFSEADLRTVKRLLSPEMGTEIMAPLLHYLVRFTRAQNVVEGGAGYTTPFLAKALAQNKEDFDAEIASLRRKTEPYVEKLESMIASDPKSSRSSRPHGRQYGLQALYKEKSSILAAERFNWLSADPSWACPRYYLSPFRPRLVCIDQLSPSHSRAADVPGIVDTLGLSDYVTFVKCDFWTAPQEAFPTGDIPIDLIWVDLPIGVKGLFDLLSGVYWNRLRPDGGLIIMHDMMTTRGGQALIDVLKEEQEKAQYKTFEMIGLLEPQRLMQGDFVMIRKTAAGAIGAIDDIVQSACSDDLEEQAQSFLRQTRDQ
jgi:hypothetical protein